ncbi:hypothetical protein CAP35_08760 [Chitinophagaceae bacterium IBVUCB1]|nr:hypothetical protein CAP35_08760 [Chitinophagaceae bacterium IBVUCB1]
MKSAALRSIIVLFILSIASGCANIVPPEGGKKDTKPPKLLEVSPADSQLNTKASKIELRFNEYIQLNNPSTEIQVSPLISLPITSQVTGRKVVIKIPDTLLKDNTTYRISTNGAIKDLHEGNAFPPYTYTFSTGAYFDSLKLSGVVYNAATGLPDTGAFVLLYDFDTSDSIVVREKPRYVAKIGAEGRFAFDGLPSKKFRIYALHDANGNLVYDGKEEMIGFRDTLVEPLPDTVIPITLQSFKEIFIDTLTEKENKRKPAMFADRKPKEKLILTFSINADTNINKRSFDVTKPLILAFDKYADTLHKDKMLLTTDSAGADVEVAYTMVRDTVLKNNVWIKAAWKDDALYTVRFMKAFAKDSNNNESAPVKYTFRTRNDEDYGIIDIRLPLKYKDRKYLLMVTADKDTVYYKPVTDTVVVLKKMNPTTYSMRIVVDENKNGKWDTGDLFEKRQPEMVIPYIGNVPLKAGWESVVDFEPKPKIKDKADTSPEKRDKPPTK